MKRYMNGLCYYGDIVQYSNGVKTILDKNVEFSYDEETDRFIELRKSIIPIMDILYSNLSEEEERECFEKFKEIGIPYKKNNKDQDIYVDEDSIVISSIEEIYLKKIVKEGILKVPKCMFPDKEDWKKLGFSFNEPNYKEADYYYMKVPNNWSLEINERCGVFNIIDDVRRARGYINPSVNNYYKEPFMILFPRYNIHRYIDDSGEYLYFGEKDRPLFMSNAITENNRKMNDITIFGKSIIEFPGWKNPSKYWDRRSVKKLIRNN